jgi:hypothetical protein
MSDFTSCQSVGSLFFCDDKCYWHIIRTLRAHIASLIRKSVADDTSSVDVMESRSGVTVRLEPIWSADCRHACSLEGTLCIALLYTSVPCFRKFYVARVSEKTYSAWMRLSAAGPVRGRGRSLLISVRRPIRIFVRGRI